MFAARNPAGKSLCLSRVLCQDFSVAGRNLMRMHPNKCYVIYKTGRWIWHSVPSRVPQTLKPYCVVVVRNFYKPTGLNVNQNLEQVKEDKIPLNDKYNDYNLNLEKSKAKIVYSSVLEQKIPTLGYKQIIKESRSRRIAEKERLNHIMNSTVYPVSMKYIDSQIKEVKEDKSNISVQKEEEKVVHLPYASFQEVNHVIDAEDDSLNGIDRLDYASLSESKENQLSHIHCSRYSKTNFQNQVDIEINSGQHIKRDEMFRKHGCEVGSEIDPAEEDDDDEGRFWQLNYGTSNRTIPVSNVPCGGCGAFLHCQDTAIPGYIPYELFEGKTHKELHTMICQRCHFLKHHNMALGVNISAEDYPRILSKIKDEFALVILMVDLMDFPCSVWPQILDIIGHKRPVCVVGNKVDLLPQDSRGYLEHIKFCLQKSMEDTGISAANIKHICLISAKTGFGVEELITKLQNSWNYKGDVYLIGCTNVGKSSLFNTLLQSDFCKVKAVDLVQRATTSVWPGTTLNLLKFPMLRPSGWRLYMRTKRLLSERTKKHAEQRLRKQQLQASKDTRYSTLIGHIGMTFKPPPDDVSDPFSMKVTSAQHTPPLKYLNPAHRDFVESKWCYDTPGTVQPGQILNLLTTEELMLTLPKDLISPRSYCIKPHTTLFLGGLGRIDYTDGSESIKFTVFSSEALPVTICNTVDAEDLYSKFLGTELLKVPSGGNLRLQKWPEMRSKYVELTGIGWKESCADILLSSAGWVAITPKPGMLCKFQVFTPEGRGIFVRQPALLRYAVNLRGSRISHTCAYKKSKAFIQ